MKLSDSAGVENVRCIMCMCWHPEGQHKDHPSVPVVLTGQVPVDDQPQP